MSTLCVGPLGTVLWLSVAFLAASLLIGVLSAAKALRAKSQGVVELVDVLGQPIAPILEALKGLIEALGKAPAWFALFLAGIFLFWLAGTTYVDACKPVTPVEKSSTIKTTVITRTIQPTSARTNPTPVPTTK